MSFFSSLILIATTGFHSQDIMSAPNGQTISICGNIFRLVETIGRGSYGTVHKGLNVGSSAEVAIKGTPVELFLGYHVSPHSRDHHSLVISKEKLQKPHERNSIEKEIETMRVAVEQYENGHPHIVRLLCTKESQHHIFIVLEYCAGGDISTYIKLNGGLPEQKARVFMSHLGTKESMNRRRDMRIDLIRVSMY